MKFSAEGRLLQVSLQFKAGVLREALMKIKYYGGKNQVFKEENGD